MLSSQHSIAAWLHDTLSDDVTVQSVLGDPARLYDHLPEDPVYPYLTYGTARTTDISGDACPLQSHVLNLHIWSRYSGRAEVLQILANLTRVLETAPSPDTLIALSVTYTDVFRAPDGRSLHGLIRLTLTTQSQLETTP